MFTTLGSSRPGCPFGEPIECKSGLPYKSTAEICNKCQAVRPSVLQKAINKAEGVYRFHANKSLQAWLLKRKGALDEAKNAGKRCCKNLFDDYALVEIPDNDPWECIPLEDGDGDFCERCEKLRTT